MERLRQEDFANDLFSTIANRYDLLNTALTLNRDTYWRNVAASKANLQMGHSVLDVCCGTGKLSIALATFVGAKGQVVGLDFCKSMLQKAQTNIDQTPYQTIIKLMQGNALHLPFADNSFDCVSIGFGLRNVSNIKNTLLEMSRVVKPGGTILSVELSKPNTPIIKKLYYLYVDYILPRLGNLGLGESSPYHNLPTSLKTLPHQLDIRDIFCSIGLQQVLYYELTGGIATIHVGKKHV